MSEQVPGMVTDPDEVARFAAERDQDVGAERRLFLGQLLVLVAVIAVGVAMALLGAR